MEQLKKNLFTLFIPENFAPDVSVQSAFVSAVLIDHV